MEFRMLYVRRALPVLAMVFFASPGLGKAETLSAKSLAALEAAQLDLQLSVIAQDQAMLSEITKKHVEDYPSAGGWEGTYVNGSGCKNSYGDPCGTSYSQGATGWQ